jgi:F420-non-reducing hydrogenase iron-sulfur subunit
MSSAANFEPRIIAFLCHWCAYGGADLAGTNRYRYPPNVRAVRIMCSGSVNPASILMALLHGADGVLIAGCHLGNCHYQSGNYRAEHRIEMLKTILHQVGIDKDRVWLRWIDASEGGLFRDTVHQMVTEIRAKGPNPMRTSWKLWQNSLGEWMPQSLKLPVGDRK